MNIHFKAEALKNDITALLLEFPELADDATLRADVIEGQTNTNDVLAALVNSVLEAESMAVALSLRGREISDRKKRFDNQGEALRKVILSIMERAGLAKVLLTEATLSSRFIAPAPVVTEPEKLPDDCVRIERKPDMAAIKAAIEGKREIDGVVMSNGKSSLTIRTK